MEQVTVSGSPRRGRWRRTLVAGAAGGSLLAAATAGAAAAAGNNVRVSTVRTSSGKVLASGKTLYTLQPSSTACTAQCLKVWPALILPKGVTRAAAGPGVQQSKLGTARLAGGRLQVTYGGKRLYWFAGDSAAGMVNGNVTDQWGKWSSVTVRASSGGSGGSSSNPGNSTAGTGGTSF